MAADAVGNAYMEAHTDKEKGDDANTTTRRTGNDRLRRSSGGLPVVPRRDRIHVLREFILSTFEADKLRRGYVLDVAGGRGDLSFVLCNADGLSCVVVDPRRPDHDKIARTCAWYRAHPAERAAQRAAGQALAGLALEPPFALPLHLAIYFEAHDLLRALRPQPQRRQQQRRQEEGPGEEWRVYWAQARARVQKIRAAFRPHRQEKARDHHQDDDDDGTRRGDDATGSCGSSLEKTALTGGGGTVESADLAWNIFHSVTLVLGFHPDEVCLLVFWCVLIVDVGIFLTAVSHGVVWIPIWRLVDYFLPIDRPRTHVSILPWPGASRFAFAHVASFLLFSVTVVAKGRVAMGNHPSW